MGSVDRLVVAKVLNDHSDAIEWKDGEGAFRELALIALATPSRKYFFWHPEPHTVEKTFSSKDRCEKNNFSNAGWPPLSVVKRACTILRPTGFCWLGVARP